MCWPTGSMPMIVSDVVPDGENTAWAERLLAVASAFLTISVLYLWLRAFYFGASPNSVISFAGSDAPYMPGGQIARTILGVHYFGDFQIEYAYGHLLHTGRSPYIGSYIHDDQSPLSAVIFSVFSLVSITRAALIYFAITIGGM